jgi:Cap4 dsDNA endonuclease
MAGEAIQLSLDDDSGSATLARYEFQLTLTALECLRMLVDPAVKHIVCEWAEDYVVQYERWVELVSVKHLEPSRGAWNLTEIVSEGGLQHLFDRWVKNGKQCRCRLQTNGGLRTGNGGASFLPAACSGNETAAAATLVVPKLRGEPDAGEVEEFLLMLTIQSALPKRDDLLARVLVEELPPIAHKLGWPSREHVRRFSRIRAVVAEAASCDMQAVARDLSVDLSPEHAKARAFARKTVTRDRIANAISADAASSTTMAQKLAAGGFAPTDIERCKRLRADWLAFSYRVDSGLSSDSASSVLRRTVQDLAVQAESTTRVPGSQYGVAMRLELVAAVRSTISAGALSALTTDQVLGVVYDETDRCHVWWSDHFDLRWER